MRCDTERADGPCRPDVGGEEIAVDDGSSYRKWVEQWYVLMEQFKICQRQIKPAKTQHFERRCVFQQPNKVLSKIRWLCEWLSFKHCNSREARAYSRRERLLCVDRIWVFWHVLNGFMPREIRLPLCQGQIKRNLIIDKDTYVWEQERQSIHIHIVKVQVEYQALHF